MGTREEYYKEVMNIANCLREVSDNTTLRQIIARHTVICSPEMEVRAEKFESNVSSILTLVYEELGEHVCDTASYNKYEDIDNANIEN